MLRVILVNLVMLLAIFGIAEGALAYLLGRTEPTGIKIVDKLVGKVYWKSVNYIQFLPDCAEYDSELFYRLKPGECTFENRVFSTQVTVNSAGLRDDEASLEAPQIMVIGDSHAMGWGVEDDETFAHLVEEETGIRTLNAAISSYATAREVTMAKRMDHSAVDVLVVQWSHNDDRENRAYLEAGNTLETSSESDYAAAVATAEAEASYYPFKHLINTGVLLIEQFRPKQRTGDPSNTEIDQDRFLRILTDLDLGDRRPALIVMELSNYGEYTVFNRGIDASPYLEGLSERYSSVHVFNTDELLDAGDYLGGDGHTNQSGHRKIADAIIATLPEAGIAAN